MSVALCLSGQPRFYKEAYPYLREVLLDRHNPDCYLHYWFDPKNIGSYYSKSAHASDSMIESTTVEDLADMYGGVQHHEPEREPFYPKSDREYSQPGPGVPTDIQFSMFYSMMKCLEMMEDSDKKYDLVIRSRYDFAPMSHLPDQIGNDKLYFYDFIPPRNGTHVLCDYIMFGSQGVMSEVGNTFNRMDEYYDTGTMVCGEEMLMRHMKECGIQTVPIPAHGILVRDKGLNITNFGRPSPKRI